MKQENKSLAWKIGYALGTIMAFLACVLVIALLFEGLAMILR
jgi:hypothetical protein